MGTLKDKIGKFININNKQLGIHKAKDVTYDAKKNKHDWVK